VENDFGRCEGKTKCTENGLAPCSAKTPVPEECNGLDDDCDGQTDEDIPARECNKTSGEWTCKGLEVCEGGKWVCKAQEPTDEKCDNVDNDCDGETDEEGAIGCSKFYKDEDEDSYGTDDFKCLCYPSAPYTATVKGDCDDSDASINPIKLEVCNGKDDNCDGRTDEEGAALCVLYYKDKDGDGFGASTDSKCLCAPFGDYVAMVSGDCDDSNALLNPNALETCNQMDDNCNNQTDEEGAVGCKEYYKDMDADGFGVDTDSKCLCGPVPPYSALVGGDCNDTSSLVHPLSVETCNNLDDNCDGVTDEEGAQGCQTYYLDNDHDGHGALSDSKCLCAPSGSYTATSSDDCDDNNPLVFPGALELCNQKDDNCDGQTDEEMAQGCKTYYWDHDGDGHGVLWNSKCLCAPSSFYRSTTGDDCDDNDLEVYPSAMEKCNQKDDDCDGVTDEENSYGCRIFYYDADFDGYGVTSIAKCLCVPSGNYAAQMGGDCNDNDRNVYPGATESCNQKDDDCDGSVDEENAVGCLVYYFDGDSDGYGVTYNSRCFCVQEGKYTTLLPGDCDDSNPTISPGAVEQCANLIDDNCNGQTDEEGAQGCVPYFYDFDGDNFGITLSKCLCAPDPQTKFTALNTGDCNDNDATVNPSAIEKCNNKDDNCDGQVDEERQAEQCGVDGYSTFYLDADSDTYGVTGDTKCLCFASGNYKATMGGDCDDSDASINPGATERCNDKDDNCNGATDEAWPLKGEPCDGPDSDLCLEGQYVCKADGSGIECDDMTQDSVEVCDNIDNDCDGLVDEDCKVLVLVRNLGSLDPEEQAVVSFLQQNGYTYDIADSSTIPNMSVPRHKIIYFRTAAVPLGYNSQPVLQVIRSAVESGSSLFVEYYGCYLAQYLGWGSVGTSGWWPVVHDTVAFVTPITSHPIFDGIPRWDPPSPPDRIEQVIWSLPVAPNSTTCVWLGTVEGASSVEFWNLIMTYGWAGQNTNSEYCLAWGGCTPERAVHRYFAIRYAVQGQGKLVVLDAVGVRGSPSCPITALGVAGKMLLKNILRWAGGI
jgi:hypothetical protein